MYKSASELCEGIKERMKALGKVHGMSATLDNLASISEVPRSAYHKFLYGEAKPSYERLDEILAAVEKLESQEQAA